MEFCVFCDNMLYVKNAKEDENQFDVNYYCKNCNYSKSISDKKESLMLINNLYSKERSHALHVNPDIEYDPTLPHVDNIECPNEECTTKKSKQRNDVIYMKYDVPNIRYLYFCVHCKHFWKNDIESANL